MYLDGVFDLLNIFKRKPAPPKECFFCKISIDEKEAFTVQYSSKDGLHSQKVCGDCATTLNEIVDTTGEDHVG